MSTTPLTGRPRGRRSLLSDQEVRERMLGAAEGMVEADGLTVSLEHVSFEEVIRRAGVSRSAAFRLWPSKEDFFLDFLDDLAGPEWQGNATFDDRTMELAAEIVGRYEDRLDTPEGRRQALRHAVREAVAYNFSSVSESVQWKTYLALTAMILSAPEGQAKDRLKARLAESEKGLSDKLAEFYVLTAATLGLRPRPPFDQPGTNGELPLWAATLAALGSAIVEGLVLRRTLLPEVPERAFAIETPEGAEEWSLISLAYLSLVDLVLEPAEDA
jgi:AcrR family transcriptional regulator